MKIFIFHSAEIGLTRFLVAIDQEHALKSKLISADVLENKRLDWRLVNVLECVNGSHFDVWSE